MVVWKPKGNFSLISCFEVKVQEEKPLDFEIMVLKYLGNMIYLNLKILTVKWKKHLVTIERYYQVKSTKGEQFKVVGCGTNILLDEGPSSYRIFQSINIYYKWKSGIERKYKYLLTLSVEGSGVVGQVLRWEGKSGFKYSKFMYWICFSENVQFA